MAEIRIEKKKPIWPWILGAILLIAIIALFMWDDDDKETEVVADETRQEEAYNENENAAATYDTSDSDYKDDTANSNNTANATSGNAVEQYRMHIRNDNGKMGEDHKYTHEAFTKLSGAISYTANQKNYDVKADLSNIKTWADEIQKDPASLKHANKIQKGLKEVLTSFQNIQKKHYPNLEGEIDDLKDLYNEWDANKPTLEQKQTLKKFFDEAGEILGKMKTENNK